MKFSEIDFNLRNLSIVLFTIFICFLIYHTIDIIIMFMVSVLIAYLLNPIVEFFERFHIPRFLGVLILVLMLMLLIVGFVAIVLPSILKDIIFIVNNMPQYINSAFKWLEEILLYFDIKPSLDLETIKSFIVERIGVISQYVLNSVSSALTSVKNIGLFIVNIFIIPVLVFFLLTDFPNFKLFTGKIVERFNMQKIMEHLAQFETLVGKYFRGMFLVGFILSCLYSLVLFIVDVKLWFVFGAITGFGALLPYVGFTIGLIFSLTATVFTYYDYIHPLYVLIGFGIVQVLDSTVITPKIVGDSLGISPVVVIVGLLLGGALWGFFGMLIALPIAAFIKILLDQYVFKTKKLDKKAKVKNSK